MDILYTVDNNFVPQLAANIYSLASNHSGSNDITFHVFSKGISNLNQSKLESQVADLKQKIAFYDISDFMKKLDFEFDTRGWNEIVLARLLMAEFLPQDLSRVIYLDADTIVLDDISELWNENLGNKILGMVCEPTADSSRRNSLGISSYFYHNAGVLLVDLTAWRRDHCQSEVLKYCSENAGKLFANDQDALNVVFKDAIASIGIRFNYSNIFDYYSYDFLNNLMPGFSSKEDYALAKQHPTIVHYLGEERPWRHGNTHRFKSDYDYYIAKTCWRDAKQEEGWEGYFYIWRLFNLLTRPFPTLRYRVINSLIPAFMKYRAAMRKKA